MSAIGQVLLVGLVLLIIVACSGAGDSVQENPTTAIAVETLSGEHQPTPSPLPLTPTPSDIPAVVAPTVATQPISTRPISTNTPEIDLPDLALSDTHIEQCRITGDLGKNGVSGQGTAPAPTPTPIRTADSRPAYVVLSELSEFRVEVTPVTDALLGYNAAFQSMWPHADTVEEQAAQLHVFGNRLAQLCSAMSQPSIPPEVFGEVAGLGDSIRARHAWTALALDELICCGDAHTAFLDIGLNSTSLAIERTASMVTEFLDGQLAKSEPDSERSITSDRFGLTMVIGSDAILVRNTVDVLIALVEPSEILNPKSLGPEPWIDGTALRIRRLRNISELSAEQAIIEYAGLLSRFGEVQRTNELDIPEVDEIQLAYPQLSDGWSGSVTVFVAGGNTYLVELMCHQSEPDSCGSAGATVESIRFVQ